MPLASQLGAFQLSGAGRFAVLDASGGALPWRAATEIVPAAEAMGEPGVSGRAPEAGGAGGPRSGPGAELSCIFCDWRGSVEGFGWHLQAVHKVPEYLVRGLVRKRCGGLSPSDDRFVRAFCAERTGPDPLLVPDDCAE